MGQRAFDETIQLTLELDPLLRTRTILEGAYEARLESERGRIAGEIVRALDASLTARGYACAERSGAGGVWTRDGAGEEDAARVAISLPSSSSGGRALRALVGAGDVGFTIDDPAFAALAPEEEDPAGLEEPSDPSLSSPDLPTAPPKYMGSPQALDHARYHARVARMKRDIAEAREDIAELERATAALEASRPHRFVSESGVTLETVEALLDAILDA